jgi:hypothetical protein
VAFIEIMRVGNDDLTHQRTNSMTRKRVFIGSFDDKVAQFPWLETQTPALPIHQLVQNVILGRSSLVTDIHLILNPWARKNLENRGDSSILNLIKVGGIEIPRREANFNKLISVQKSAGIPSFMSLKSKDEHLFNWLDEELSGTTAGPACPSSEHIWAGYSRMVGALAKAGYKSLSSIQDHVTEGQFDRVMEEFQRRAVGSRSPSRRDFEGAIGAVLSSDSLPYQQLVMAEQSLMNVANELFHVNFASLLSARLREDILVETMSSAATSSRFDFTQESDAEARLKKNLLTIDYPLAVLEQGNIEKLYSTASPVGRARLQFADVFDRYHDCRASLIELSDVADEYSRRIRESLTRPNDAKHVAQALSLFMAGAGVGLGLLLPGAAPAIMLGGAFWVVGEKLPMLADRAMSSIGRVPQVFRQRAKPYIPLSSPLSRDFVDSHSRAVLKG